MPSLELTTTENVSSPRVATPHDTHAGTAKKEERAHEKSSGGGIDGPPIVEVLQGPPDHADLVPVPERVFEPSLIGRVLLARLHHHDHDGTGAANTNGASTTDYDYEVRSGTSAAAAGRVRFVSIELPGFGHSVRERIARLVGRQGRIAHLEVALQAGHLSQNIPIHTHTHTHTHGAAPTQSERTVTEEKQGPRSQRNG